MPTMIIFDGLIGNNDGMVMGLTVMMVVNRQDVAVPSCLLQMW